MQKVIDQLRKLLLEFIEQRDDLLLLVACPPSEAALMLKIMLDQERNRKADLFYLFAEDFTAGQPYVDGIVNRLRRDYEASVESAGPDLEPLPALPTDGFATTERPQTRLHAAFSYARGLVPPTTGHRIVWGLSPGQITNVGEFAELLHGCLPQPKIEPWMRGLRLIARVPETYSDASALAKGPRVRFHRFAVPPDAAENELKDTVDNVRAPIAERMGALLQLSFFHLAYGRLDEATNGFRGSLAYFQKADDPARQALVMIGLGDTCRRAGDIDKAKYWYECAIRPAGEAKNLMSLSLIAQHLGAIAYERRQFEDATFYYGQLVILKRAITDEDGLVEALLWRGRSEEKLGDAERALVSWEEAMLITRTFELEHREKECLDQLRSGFQKVGRAGAGDAAIREWQTA